jgi:hypothetical protein
MTQDRGAPALRPEPGPFISDGLQVTLDYLKVLKWKLHVRGGLDERHWE